MSNFPPNIALATFHNILYVVFSLLFNSNYFLIFIMNLDLWDFEAIFPLLIFLFFSLWSGNEICFIPILWNLFSLVFGDIYTYICTYIYIWREREWINIEYIYIIFYVSLLPGRFTLRVEDWKSSFVGKNLTRGQALGYLFHDVTEVVWCVALLMPLSFAVKMEGVFSVSAKALAHGLGAVLLAFPAPVFIQHQPEDA